MSWPSRTRLGVVGERGEGVQQVRGPEAGMKDVYTNTSVDFGTSDVTPLVLAIKNSGADAVDLPMQSATNIALVQGLKQSGWSKANIIATGYGQEILDSPASVTLGPNDLFFLQTKRSSLKDKATKQFQADLERDADFTGVPGYGSTRAPRRRPPGHWARAGRQEHHVPELRRAARSAPGTARAQPPARSTSASRTSARPRRRTARTTPTSRTESSPPSAAR